MNKTFLLLLIATLSLNGQDKESQTGLSEQLYASHETFKAGFIEHRRFKHAEIMKFISELGSPLSDRKVGSSVAGKDIRMVSFGQGDETVLLWSQMHGNEPTATMALMDIFNFLRTDDDEFDELRMLISEYLTVHFIPMLNPDGADKFVRRNNQGIDINRDALRLQTPEGTTLKRMRDSLDADWGFNLHDQGRSSFIKDKSATISVLAPAYDFEKSINEKRGDAMKLIALMNENLQAFIHGQVSQYSDDFEPRAFGDNIQKWGTRTILIESGGLLHDREKQKIRRLNFMAILMALQGIATNSHEGYSIEDYFDIPKTSRGFRDVIVRNIQLPETMGGNLTDIAINFNEVENTDRTSYYLRANLVDVGDLSTSGAYLIHDASGYVVKPGKVYPEEIAELSELKVEEVHILLQDGFTDILVGTEPKMHQRKSIPMKLIRKPSVEPSRLSLGTNPSLLFYKADVLEFVLVNGYFFSPSQNWDRIVAGMKKL